MDDDSHLIGFLPGSPFQDDPAPPRNSYLHSTIFHLYHHKTVFNVQALTAYAVKFGEWNLKVVQEPTPWPAKSSKCIGINSFGYGGANAHVIIQSPETFLPPLDTKYRALRPHEPRRKFLLPVSASSEASLKLWLDRMSSSNLEDYALPDLAYTLCARRSHEKDARGYLITSEESLASDWKAKNFSISIEGRSSTPRLAFVFTGQGAQWPGMGKQLIEHFPSVRQTLQELDRTLKRIPEPYSVEWSLCGMESPQQSEGTMKLTTLRFTHQ
jgi:acyl transferase domain-containing protein